MTRIPRALIVDLSTRFGGTSARVLGLLSGMAPHHAALASLAGSPVTEQAVATGFDVHVVGNHKFSPKIAHRLASLVRHHDFQVLDAQNPQSKLWASRAAARCDVALISTLNSWYLSEHRGNLKGRFYQAMERWTSHKLDLFITVSPEITQQLSLSGVPAEQIALVPNAIKIDSAAVQGDGTLLREQFGFPADSQVICAIGRLVPAKGFEHLISCMQEMVSRFPNVRCLIVGDGNLHQPLASQIVQLGLESVVRLAGYQPRTEVLNIMRASDLFAMPSLSEGTPVALLEAAALGKPIIASQVGGIPSMVTHNHSALLVQPGDVRSFSEAIGRLLIDRAFAAELGQKAQRRIQTEFSLSAQVDATIAAYTRATDSAAKRRRAPVPSNRPHAADGVPDTTPCSRDVLE